MKALWVTDSRYYPHEHGGDIRFRIKPPLFGAPIPIGHYLEISMFPNLIGYIQDRTRPIYDATLAQTRAL